jgi:hypothetical protein
MLIALPGAVQAQFVWTTNSGAITITGYSGTDDVVTISGTINGFPVTRIGTNAFYRASLTSVAIPNGSFFFSDPQWRTYPGRFYRLRSP